MIIWKIVGYKWLDINVTDSTWLCILASKKYKLWYPLKINYFYLSIMIPIDKDGFFSAMGNFTCQIYQRTPMHVDFWRVDDMGFWHCKK